MDNKPTLESPAAEKKYVCGFLFRPVGSDFLVALIHKNRPEFQAGKWNGIGGKIEAGERPIDAMIREFREETGAEVKDWKFFCETFWETGYVHFFASMHKDVEIKTVTDEPVEWFYLSNLYDQCMPLLPNVRWLAPMALCRLQESFVGAVDFSK